MATTINTAADLWQTLPAQSLRRRYVALLARARKGDLTVGVLEDAIEPEGVSDWEAAACIEAREDEELTLDAIQRAREGLNKASPLVIRTGHRKGRPIFTLTPELPLKDDA